MNLFSGASSSEPEVHSRTSLIDVFHAFPALYFYPNVSSPHSFSTVGVRLHHRLQFSVEQPLNGLSHVPGAV